MRAIAAIIWSVLAVVMTFDIVVVVEAIHVASEIVWEHMARHPHLECERWAHYRYARLDSGRRRERGLQVRRNKFVGPVFLPMADWRHQSLAALRRHWSDVGEVAG